MKPIKRTIAVMLAVLMLVGMLAAVPFTASAESGSCGGNLTWELADGVLTISGTGNMYNYDNGAQNAPWMNYGGSIESVVIGNGVTSIGNFAFSSCSMTQIDLPETLTSIGNSAFFMCSQLESVYIPASVTSIGTSPFWACRSLAGIFVASGNNAFCDVNGVLYNKAVTTLISYPSGKVGTTFTVPDTVTQIADYAMFDCFYASDRLYTVTIPGSVTTIGEYALADMSSGNDHAVQLYLSDGLQQVGECAFIGLGVTSVTIPGTLTEVGEGMFSNCSRLTSVTVEYGVETIGLGAFAGCPELTEVKLPDSVTTIYNNAFWGCESLENIHIPSSVTSIGDMPAQVGAMGGDYGVFEGCTSLEYICSDAANSAAETYADENGIEFRQCSGGTCGDELYWHIHDGVLTISGIGDMDDYAPDANAPWDETGEIFSRVVIERGVTGIGEFAFDSNGITSVSIADTVTRIGTGGFAESGLTSVTIPGSMETWSEAFVMCRSLTSVTILPGVETLDNMCFGGCESLTSVTIPDTVTAINAGAFHLCYDLSEITIPDSVETIGTAAFAETALESVILPPNLTSISEDLFAGCEDLYYVEIPEGVTAIEACAFSGCSSLQNVHIPDSIQTFGVSVFEGCHSDFFLCSYIEDGIVKQYCDYNGIDFRWCALVADGDWTYCFHNGEATIRLYTGTQNNVTVPSQLGGYPVTGIQDFVGGLVVGDIHLTIPASVTHINALTWVGSNIADFTVDSANPVYSNDENGVLYNKNKTTLVAYPSCAARTWFEVPATVTEIGDYAFEYAPLTQITLPSGLLTIGNEAFIRSSLESVMLPSTLTTIGIMAFCECTDLGAEGIHIPASVTTIGDGAFGMCGQLAFLCAEDANGVAAQYVEQENINAQYAPDVYFTIEFRVCDGHNDSQPDDSINVTIRDSIGVNFHLDFDDPSRADVDSVTVTYKNFDGETVTETYQKSDLPVKDGKYIVTVWIAPAQLSDVITVNIGDTEYNQSVLEYCEDLRLGEENAVYFPFLTALEQYAQAAKAAFNYPGETIVDISGLTVPAELTEWNYQLAASAGIKDMIDSIAFLALTKPEFRFYTSSISEETAMACTVTAYFDDGGAAGDLHARFAKNAQGDVLIEVTGIDAKDLGRTVVVTITGLGETAQQIRFAGYDFAKLMTASDNNADLGAALYNYGKAANALWA